MAWNLDFISEEDFKKHVRATIMKYGEKLESYDLKRFNSNLIDPIKLIFDKSVYRTSWEEIVNNEIFRQRDKSNNNDIGYFHQNIFSYFKGCEVPQAGWDVIYRNPDGIQMPDGDIVHTIYVEMKNKHNTMNSASSAKTYIKMQGQILEDDDCACLLVEAIAKKSQNIKWSTKVDGKNVQHRLIRRVSMDQFYAILTGEEDAFYKMCMVLPEVINSVVNEEGCEVPQAGWDVIYKNPEGIQMPDGDIVHTIYVEMKNKHNTMNSASSAKTYIKMQGQILEDDDCACLLVEAIAKKSQNIKWSTKVDGKNVQHRLIRRVSMDQFYAILTGEEDAFYKMCMALPEVINSVVNEEGGVEVPHDTVIDELRKVASLYGDEKDELSMAMAVYMLGFNTYMGFGDKIRGELGEDKDGMLKRIYEYVKRLK